MTSDPMLVRLQAGTVVDEAGNTLFAHAVQPLGFFSRLRGLIGRMPLTEQDAWWFAHCSAVHTFGMSFAIDVVHLSADGRVLKICSRLKPGRYSAVSRGGHVVELKAGAAQLIEQHNIRRLSFRP